jgi:hypothetical protein
MSTPSNNPEDFLKNTHFFKDVSPLEAEIVITRFNEPLEWTKDIAHLCTVYNKGAEPLPSYSFNKIIPIPNFGLGIETILRHIILNYDSLAFTTFFCQGMILDRSDQPLYPLEWYLLNQSATGFKGFEDTLYDSPNFRITEKVKDNDLLRAVNERNLEKFRKEVIGMPYRLGIDKWVKGDWFSIGSKKIREKPIQYYMSIYISCQFHRGIIIEELWYLERCYHSIFNRPVESHFNFIPPLDEQQKLLEYLSQENK